MSPTGGLSRKLQSVNLSSNKGSVKGDVKGSVKPSGKPADSSNPQQKPTEGAGSEDESDDFMVVDKEKLEKQIEVDAKARLDADQRVLFIEYMRRGRFEDYVAKTALSGKRVPDEVLWQIFDCCKYLAGICA